MELWNQSLVARVERHCIGPTYSFLTWHVWIEGMSYLCFDVGALNKRCLLESFLVQPGVRMDQVQ